MPTEPSRDSAACEAPGAPDLDALIDRELRQPVPAAVPVLVEALTARYGACVLAILHYGACLRSGEDGGSIVDLYVLVDRYANCHRRRATRLANRLLPPNVHYLEVPFQGRLARCKYAIITLEQFEHHTGGGVFDAAIRARFAQPCALVWAADEAVRGRVRSGLAAAVRCFLAETLGLLPPRFTAEQWWTRALAASYASELRPEQPEEAAARLTARAPERWRRTALAALPAMPCPVRVIDAGAAQLAADCSARERARARRRWRRRRLQGKALNLARLVKGLFTFEGGVDYALWKIERHSGIHVEPSPLLRRHPLIGMWPLAWRLYRKGAFR